MTSLLLFQGKLIKSVYNFLCLPLWSTVGWWGIAKSGKACGADTGQ